MKSKGWILDLLLLFLLAVAAYVSSFKGAWQFDDFRCIVSNSSLRGQLIDVWHFSPGRFFVFLTFWGNYRLCALDTFWYHFVNLALHILNGFLFYYFLLLLQEAAGKKEERRFPAFLCAALFLAHPVNTQAVTYIVQRLELMCFTFFLMHLIFLLLSLKRKIFLLGAILALIAGLFCKENMAVAPLIAILGYFAFAQIDLKTFLKEKKKYLFIAATAFLLLCLLVLRFAGVWKGTSFDFSPLARLYEDTPDVWAYFATQFKVWIIYLRLCFWPFGLRLEYDVPLEGFSSIWVIMAIVFWIALAAFTWINRKKYPYFAFGLGFFALALAPAATLIPNGLYEHRLYCALPGILIAVIFTFFSKKNIFNAAFLSVIILLFTYASFQRNFYWSDAELIWRDNLKYSPENFRVNANVGEALLNKEQYGSALPYLKKAIELRPRTVEAHYNLACCLAGMGDLKGAKEELLTAKKLKSRLPEVKRLVDEAIKEIDQALGE